MRLVITSDTEGDHREVMVPNGDVFIVAGDIISYGMVEKYGSYHSQLDDFLEWMGSLPHKHKIFIGGNHDSPLLAFDKRKIPEGVHYLENESIELDGYKFWGSPNTVAFFRMPFEQPEDKLAEIYGTIPEDVDVLITHCPPLGVLDKSSRGKHCGSTSLAKRLTEIKPKVHAFGHIHESYGHINNNGIETFNASFQYKRNNAFTIDI